MPDSKKKYTLKQHASMIIRGLRTYGDPGKPVMLTIVLSSILEAAVPFINIWFAAEILSELAGLRDRQRLVLLAALTVSLNLAGFLGQKALTRWKSYCGVTAWDSGHKRVTDKAIGMAYSDFEDADVQRLYFQIGQDEWNTGAGLMKLEEPAPQIIQGIIKIALSVTLSITLFTSRVPNGPYSSWLNSPLAIAIVIAILAVQVLLSPYLNVRGGRIFAALMDDGNYGNRFFAHYFFDIHEDSAAAKDIRIYDQKRIIRRQVAEDGDQNWRNNRTWSVYRRYEGKYIAAGVAVTYLCNGLLFLYVALKALAGAFGVGSIVLYVGAITQFSSGISAVLSMAGQLVNNNLFLEKWFRYLDLPNNEHCGDLSVGKGADVCYEIELRNVSFKYPGTDLYVLNDVSMKFNIGERMAIVGENGSGKTTLVKLLCRLYDPTEGEILLNGVNIREYSFKEYIRIFSIVFQDFGLLPFTLGQNVAVSAVYDAKRAREALEDAGFGERLASLPMGLDTLLYKEFDEEGVEPSGGEAQKIALARALYRDASFIILDEPTAALDPIAEFEVYSKINDIIKGKTAVFISHRLSSCRFCSDIAVFHEGRLIQRGAHDVLVEDVNGKYFELWNAQAQYYH